MFKGFTCLVIFSLWCAAGSVAANALPGAPITRVIDRAHALLGTPNNGAGNSVGQGFDCSGLLVYLFKTEANIQLPRTTAAMQRSTAATIRRNALKAGDAVFFKGNGGGQVSHVGLYIGEGKFIHSPRAGKHIRIDSLSNSYWNKNYTTAKRFHTAG